MIFGAQIGLLIYGIFAIIKGQFSFGKGKKVVGTRARWLGAISLAPLPLSAISGFIIGFFFYETLPQMQWLIVTVEAGILVCTIIVLFWLANHFYKQQESTPAHPSEVKV